MSQNKPSTPALRIESLVATGMRIDWLEVVYKQFGKPGLPLDREGVKMLVNLATSDIDAVDILWLFESLTLASGIEVARKILPPSPIDNDVSVTSMEKHCTTSTANELRDVRNRYDAAHRALSRAGANEGYILAAVGHKHFFNALVAKRTNHDPRRTAIHLAKSVISSLKIKFAKDPTARAGLLGNFFDDALLVLSADLTTSKQIEAN